MKEIFNVSEALGMTVARLPSLSDFKNETADPLSIKPIDVEDLLGRPQTTLNKRAVEELIRGRRVLVTGAGGSIGSELVRQLAGLGPSHLSLVDNSEYNLFRIDMGIESAFPEIEKSPLIADVREAARIKGVFRTERPDIVFHAAALKHVPLVESNILEGISTNVLGTRNVADAARAVDVKTFVQISTDKAVNPTNVMGATKRLAEIYCQAFDLVNAESESTTFVTVRFGNVLGSTGSVVELFRNQLAAGGPLTVTHPDMTRYFMTIRESVELVLQASALGSRERSQDGKIFVLDMGEPIKIMDLARQMIRLAGYKTGEDIDIEITGIRPGEKLFEEVLHGAEAPVPTHQDGVLVATPRTSELSDVETALRRLEDAIETADTKEALEAIRRLVPEFTSDSHFPPAQEVAE